MEIYGNPTTFNLENVLRQNIVACDYYRNDCVKLEDWQQVIDEIYNAVEHVEPWIGGNARGPSTAFCLLHRLATIRMSVEETSATLNHADSPYIRAVSRGDGGSGVWWLDRTSGSDGTAAHLWAGRLRDLGQETLEQDKEGVAGMLESSRVWGRRLSASKAWLWAQSVGVGVSMGAAACARACALLGVRLCLHACAWMYVQASNACVVLCTPAPLCVHCCWCVGALCSHRHVSWGMHVLDFISGPLICGITDCTRRYATVCSTHSTPLRLQNAVLFCTITSIPVVSLMKTSCLLPHRSPHAVPWPTGGLPVPALCVRSTQPVELVQGLCGGQGGKDGRTA